MYERSLTNLSSTLSTLFSFISAQTDQASCFRPAFMWPCVLYISLSPPCTLVCLPSFRLLCILHLSISFPTSMLAGLYASMPARVGCLLNSTAFGYALSKKEKDNAKRNPA